jgi:hypothetical protein
MIALGLDFAGGRPGGAAIARAGYGFCVRYLSDGGSRLPGKLLTASEYADLQAHDVAVVVNWETTSDRMKDGYTAGVTDAHRAVAQIDNIGHPGDRPIYFSADWDATPADQSQIDDYLRGATSVIGIDRVGVYGSYYVCKRCLDNRTATWTWQAAAWSGGLREPRAHLYQRIGAVTVNGVDCDVNEALRPDYGQHPGGDVMSAEIEQMIRDIYHESTFRLPHRRTDDVALTLPDDTVLGYGADAAALAWRNEQRLIAVQGILAALTAAVAAQHGLNLDDLRTLLDTELAKVVQVKVSIVDGDPPVTPGKA